VSEEDHARLSEGLGRAVLRPWKLTQATRLGIDAFAERYAGSRGLAYDVKGETPSDTWLLAGVMPSKSHSFMRGSLGGGADGLLFYVETAISAGGRGTLMEGWTAAHYELPVARELAEGIACVPKPGSGWGGRVHFASALPGEMTAITIGDGSFDALYDVGIVAERDEPGARTLLTGDFTAWMTGLPLGKLGDDATRFQLHTGALCVFTKGKLKTTQTLDGFCEHAARVAADVQRAAASAVQPDHAPEPVAETDRRAYGTIADRIESELRAIGAWDQPAPEGPVQGAFGAPNRSFSQWLRYDLTPRLREVAAGREDPPTTSMVGTMAIREFDGFDAADTLIDVLLELDKLAESG
jgi:tRNA pseudouridine synthase C